jgi:hypothetical protein
MMTAGSKRSSHHERLMSRIEAAVGLAAEDPNHAKAELQATRRRALRYREGAAASACLQALRMVLSEQDWLKRCAPTLLIEDPRGLSFLSVAVAEERLGRLALAVRHYECAMRIEAHANGDRAIRELAAAGIARIEKRASRTARPHPHLGPLSS